MSSASTRSGCSVDQQPGGLELVDDAGQRGAEAVVQVAADPAALLLAGVHQSLPAGLKVFGEAAGAGRSRCLPDHVAEQALVLRGQPAAQPARRKHEPAYDGVAVGDRQRTYVPWSYAAGRGQALTAGPVNLHGDVVDAERVGDSLGDRPELGGPVVDGLQARGEAGHHVVPVATAAEDPGLHEPLEPVPEWPVCERGDEQHDGHQLALAQAAERTGENFHHEQVQAEQAECDGSEHEGPDQQVLHGHHGRADHADSHRHDRQHRDDDDHPVDGGAEVRDRADGQGQCHDQHGPDEPAHLVTFGAGRATVAKDRGGHGDQNPGHCQDPAQRPKRVGRSFEGGECQEVVVDRGRHIGNVGDVGGRAEDHHEDADHHADERADAQPSQPAREEPSGGEDQQQCSDAERQDRPEPHQVPERQVGAFVRVVGPNREAYVRLGEAVQRPDRGDREQRRPEAVARVFAYDDQRAERDGQAGQRVDSAEPAADLDARSVVGCRDVQDERGDDHDGGHRGGDPRGDQDRSMGMPEDRHRRCRSSGVGDRAHRWIYRTAFRAQAPVERWARSPTRKPTEVTTSHSAATGAAMYSSGETPSSAARPPMTSPTRPIQRGTTLIRLVA